MKKKLIKVVLATILVFAMNVTVFAAGSAVAKIIEDARGIDDANVIGKDGVKIDKIVNDITNLEALKALESEAEDINNRLEKQNIAVVDSFKLDISAEGQGQITIKLGMDYANKIVIVSHYSKEGYWTRQILKVSKDGTISPSFNSFSPIFITATDYEGTIASFIRSTGIAKTEKDVEVKSNNSESVIDTDNKIKSTTKTGNSTNNSLGSSTSTKKTTVSSSGSSGVVKRSVSSSGGAKGKGKSPNTDDGYGIVWLLSLIIMCSAITIVFSDKKEQ